VGFRNLGRLEGGPAGTGESDDELSPVARMAGPADESLGLHPGQNLAEGLALDVDGSGQLLLVQGAGGEAFKGYDRRTGQPQWRKGVILTPLDQPRGQGQEAAPIPEVSL
jgi:hypothetical protein